MRGIGTSTKHPGSLCPGPRQSWCSWREQTREAPVPRRDIKAASQAGEHRHEGSLFRGQELSHRASPGVLSRRGLLRFDGHERARLSVLRGASVSQVPGHIRGRRDDQRLSDLPHAFAPLRGPCPLRDRREDQRRYEATADRTRGSYGPDSDHDCCQAPPREQTRLISLTVTDTQQQTRDIMAALADEGVADGPDLDSWHALQQWLARAERRVTIPYAKELAAKIPPLAVRLRRDFGALLNLIKAHALLHQANRQRDREGLIIATIADYAKVRDLVADLVSEGIEATVSPTVRETVATVGRLHDETEKAATLRDIAEELKLDKSTASRRVRTAIDKGFIKNLEDQRGRAGRYVPADPLPDDVEILPPPEVLQCCTVAGDAEGVKKNVVSEFPEDAGNRRSVSAPPKTDATVQEPEEEEKEIDEHGWNCLCNECLPT